jgi:hypothetical protein
MDAMCSRRALITAFASILLLAISIASIGCSSHNPFASTFGDSNQHHDADQSLAVAPPQTQPALTQTPQNTDNLSPSQLEAKVSSFTSDVGPQLAREEHRQARAEARAEAAAATQPSDATAQAPAALDTMLAPDALRLSPYEQEAQPVKHYAPPSPQRFAATGDANFPITVPEGADNQVQAQQASAVWPADQIEHQLASRVRDQPRDLEGQLNYELLLFLEDQPVPQLEAISQLRPEDRDILAAVMDGLSNFRDTVRSDNNALMSTKIKPLMDMADRLRSQTELSLDTAALCKEVKSYGVYTPFDSNRFVAGRDNPVIVYCEVENFQSQLNSDSQFETRLSEETVLYTDSGMMVWPAKSEPQAVIDLCRQRRHDFFIARIVTLPSSLTIGRYVLKLTVTDQLANRVAETSVPLEIVAQ